MRSTFCVFFLSNDCILDVLFLHTRAQNYIAFLKLSTTLVTYWYLNMIF